MERPHRFSSERPTVRFFVVIAVIAILTTVLTVVGRRTAPAAEAEREPAGAGASDALRRARALGQKLAPTEDLRLRVEFRPRRVTPVSHWSDEWAVSSSEEGIAGRFVVVFDARTAAIQRLSWAGRTYGPRSAGEEKTSRPIAPSTRNILDHARAIGAARGCLRLLGIPGERGPWTRESCSLSYATPPAVGRVWCVHLRSPHRTVFVVLDAATAELIQILVLPLGHSGA